MRFLFLISLSFFGTARLPAQTTAVDHFTILKTAMTGAFNNSAQARADKNFPDTVLHVALLWPERIDGAWLYAEQAVPRALAHPYKQTVYQLLPIKDGVIECRFYDPVDPISFTGAWQKDSLKTSLSPADLRFRENCTVVLRPQADGSYRGITDGRGCASAIRGASYTTTEIVVTDKQLVLWERGYNAAGTQVWGSVHGGVVFIKQAE